MLKQNSLMTPIVAATVLALAIVLQGQSPAAGRDIYPAPEQAQSDLAKALQSAAAGHRRVIVDFGGNWCPDCHVLDLYFHDAANKPILEADYVLVHINVGRLDRNIDIAERYQIPLKKGVPALAVLDSDGTLLYSQKTGEFEEMRRMQSGAVTEFLTRWRAAASN
jgi:thiol:disulfide interchange protein